MSIDDENSNWTNRDNFAPGSMGCHEVLHMTAFLENAVDTELCQHPAIRANPAWLAVSEIVRNSLQQLYQSIGSKHLSA